MGSHNELEEIYQYKAGLLNLVGDPGNGGTIHFTKDDAVCLLTINSAGQTRLLDSASSLPLGVRITVVADQITGGGTCTVQGQTFDAEGNRAVFEVIQYNGTKAWVIGGGGGSVVFNSDLVLGSTNEINIGFGASQGEVVSALAIDDAAIAGHAAPAATSGKSVFLATPDGGAAGEAAGQAGGSWSFVAGAGTAAGVGSDADGGASGSIRLTVQAGGAKDGAGTVGKDGAISLIGIVTRKQGDPTAETSTTQTYTAAELMGGIITSTQTGAVTATLDVGTNMDLARPTGVGVDESFDWTLINLGSSSGAVTVTASSGHTVVGNMVVAIGTSATFRSRRTAGNTWVTYRLNG